MESPADGRDKLAERLAAKPYSFDFFQAVRRMECAAPGRPRVGYSAKPAEDPVRFCQEPSLAFPPSTISAFQPGQPRQPGQQGQPGQGGDTSASASPAGRPARMYVTFMGLLGPNGPMPMHVTELARARQRNMGDPTLARFLDLFNHRMVSLFYRAWSSCNQSVSQDRPQQDRFAVYVASLIGRGMASLCDRDAVPDPAKLHYSGRLANATRHAEGLQSILADYFRLAVRVEEFFGQWIDLPPECCCRLGETPATGLLGSTVVVGSRVWDCQQKFRIRMGPMGFADFQRLLPDGGSIGRLTDWVRNYMGDELLWDVQLVLKAAEVPRITMGQQGKLGWTTWLTSRPFEKDADDLVIRISG